MMQASGTNRLGYDLSPTVVAFDARPYPGSRRARLEEYHGAATGVGARPKQLDGPATRDRESLREDVPVRPEEVAVVTRVEQEQRHARNIAVPQFQSEPSLKRLTIARPGFRFDAVPPVVADDHDVPGSAISWCRERNLRLQPDRAMEDGPQPTDQRHVGGITEGFTAREYTHRELASDRREQDRCLLDRERARHASLDPAVLRRRHSHLASDISAAETAIQAAGAQLSEHARSEFPATGRPDIDPSFSRSHRIPIVTSAAHLTLIARFVFSPSNPCAVGVRGYAFGASPGSGPTATGYPAVLQSLHEPG